MKDNRFQINVTLPDNSASSMQVAHQDETFSFAFETNVVSIINNGDNSWSQGSGETISQETINLIGEAIEKYYQQQSI